MEPNREKYLIETLALPEDAKYLTPSMKRVIAALLERIEALERQVEFLYQGD